MSLIKSIKQQLGLGPASENHFFDGSVPNQLSLKRGTPEAPGAEVLRVVDGKLSLPNQLQTWQVFAVPTDRAGDTTYINNTGQPIQVAVVVTVTAGATPASMHILDTIISSVGLTGGTSVLGTLYGVVPNGATYSIPLNSGTTIAQWREYR